MEMNGSTSLKIKNIMNIIYQGNIALDGSTRIIGTSNNLIINSIIINNQDYNYIVTVESYNQDPGVNKIILYNFELTAGDCLKDNDEYSLTNGNYLQLTSNVAETSYYIKATQN